MKIAIGNDHGGFELKKAIVVFLKEQDIEVIDVGTHKLLESGDYPDFAEMVAEKVAKNEVDSGILICGTGIGVSITANKIAGVRAAVVGDVFSAQATKEHNHANVLCLGQRVIGEGLALMIVDTWLKTECSMDERHLRRIEKIHLIERRKQEN